MVHRFRLRPIQELGRGLSAVNWKPKPSREEMKGENLFLHKTRRLREGMWAAGISLSSPFYAYPKPINSLRSSVSTRTSSKSLKLRASFFDYPLASKILVKSMYAFDSKSSVLSSSFYVF